MNWRRNLEPAGGSSALFWIIITCDPSWICSDLVESVLPSPAAHLWRDHLRVTFNFPFRLLTSYSPNELLKQGSQNCASNVYCVERHFHCIIKAEGVKMAKGISKTEEACSRPCFSYRCPWYLLRSLEPCRWNYNDKPTVLFFSPHFLSALFAQAEATAVCMCVRMSMRGI